MATLSREEILQAEDHSTVTLSVPEWGGDVLVGTLSGKERDRFESEFATTSKSNKGMDNIRAKLCALCLRDDDGKALFTMKDVAELGKKSASALDRVFTASLSLNGFTAKDVEEIAGNSEGIPAEGSI